MDDKYDFLYIYMDFVNSVIFTVNYINYYLWIVYLCNFKHNLRFIYNNSHIECLKMEGFLFILFFIGLSLFLYFKVSPTSMIRLPLISITVLFSFIFIGFTLFNYEIVGTPYIQIFFVLFQTIIFIMCCIEYFNLKRGYE